MNTGCYRLAEHAYMTSDYRAAADYAEQALKISKFIYYRYSLGPLLTHTYLKLGEGEQAQWELQQTRRFAEARLEAGYEGHHPWLDRAPASALEGKPDEALESLRKAIDTGGVSVFLLTTGYPIFAETLSENSEFQELMKELHTEAGNMHAKVLAL